MKIRGFSFVSALVLAVVVAGALFLPAATAKKRPKPPPQPPPPPPPSLSDTYVNSYANVVDGVKCDVTPVAVTATSDGGSATLALSSQPSAAASESCAGVNWLVKLDAFGNPQWQKLVGCFNLPGGYYSLGVSMRQTADGGYVIGGGTLGCGPDTICRELCGLVEKLDAAGNVVWSRVYSSGAGDRESVIYSIRPTSDGFIAAGTFRNPDSNNGAWILKLDSAGAVQWQRKLGPGGPTGTTVRHSYFEAVHAAADGGYVAAGEIMNYERQSSGDYGVLVVKVGASGNVDWQREFSTSDGNGVPTSSNRAFAIVQTPDGGSLVGGTWNTAFLDGTCCRGALLLKLDASGDVQWQKAYHGGVKCSSGAGGKTTCSAVGPVVRSLHATADGGYVLAGFTQHSSTLGAPLSPWLAKVDANGNLLWQYVYYESGSTQYFASADLASNGGHVAVGFTSNTTDLRGELFAVKTDSAGLVGGCTQIHPALLLEVVDPALANFSPGLPVQATAAAQAGVPSTTRPTSISSTPGQC